MDETKEELCRLCLKLVEDSIDLFHYKNGHRIADLVKIICPIEISEDDKLPQKICSECLELIVDSIHLRDLSIMNDQELRQRLQETEEKFEEFEEQFEIEALDEAILSEFNETVVFEAPSKLVPDVARTFCEFCNVTFFNPSSYKRHQLRKHKNIRYSCDLCNIGFLKTKVDLEGHMRKMHLTRYGSVRFMYADKLSLDITELYEKVEDQLGLSCCFCPHMDYEEESLNDHLYSHLDVVDSGKMYCTFCPSLITTMEFFIEHTKSHNEKIKTHRCLVCNKTFPFDDKFLKHLRNHKDNQHKICFCPQCGKKFSKPKLMEDHIRFIHNKESLYQCIECGQGFGSKSALNGHIKRHRDGLKFHCPFCPKSFASHNLLNSHKSVHSTERPYGCTKCLKRFKHQKILKDHMKRHEGSRPIYLCSICDKALNSAYALQRHSLTHTGAKPHHCDYCTKTYAQKNDLNKHLRLHVGENTYVCEQRGCDMRFRVLSDLRVHEASHLVDYSKN